MIGYPRLIGSALPGAPPSGDVSIEDTPMVSDNVFQAALDSAPGWMVADVYPRGSNAAYDAVTALEASPEIFEAMKKLGEHFETNYPHLAASEGDTAMVKPIGRSGPVGFAIENKDTGTIFVIMPREKQTGLFVGLMAAAVAVGIFIAAGSAR